MIRRLVGGNVIRQAPVAGCFSRHSRVVCISWRRGEEVGLFVRPASSSTLRPRRDVGDQGGVAIGARRRSHHPRDMTVRWHGGSAVSDDAPTITLMFLQPDDTTRQVEARVGETLLQTAHRNDIDLEGACEGVCACSTCHLIFPPGLYDTLPDPSEDEEDMLDMAFGLTETSRLGCQITVTTDMDGALLEMPKATRNFYVDGHVPKPH